MLSPVDIPSTRQGVLHALSQRIQGIERRASRVSHEPVDIDKSWSHLPFGETHEWFTTPSPTPADWSPPLLTLVHLARQATHRALGIGEGSRWTVWVGRRVWPYGHALIQRAAQTQTLSRSLFIDAPECGPRLWSIDAALRCPGTVVVADASRHDTASSRRLQLAAEAGGSIGIFARPPQELAWISLASTRWVVSPCVHEMSGGGCGGGGVRRWGRWKVRLVRRKGLPAMDSHEWTVERCEDGGLVAVSPDVGDRSRATLAAS
ncbi:MAG: hypothetical protein AABZ53_10800 [Planctomycetota bacterium]